MSAQYILIVDDEPSIREVVRLYLQRDLVEADLSRPRVAPTGDDF